MPALGEIIVVFDEDEAEALYLGGATFVALAERYGTSFSTIRTRLMRRGVAMRGHGGCTIERDWETIAKEYKRGSSSRMLSLKYDVSDVTILNRLRDMGVPIRRRWKRAPRYARPTCKRCGLVLEEMAWHVNGLCCYCVALENGWSLGAWVWADDDRLEESANND